MVTPEVAEVPAPRPVRPWWTPLLVVIYLSSAHLASVFAVAVLTPQRGGITVAGTVAIIGLPVTVVAILIGWLTLALSWRHPGRYPPLDALIAAGVGYLVLSIPLALMVLFAAWR